jgi:bacillithiol biosynthesis cysteine-adding enzyme BshC
MDCTCIRQTELPGTTRLFADLIYHRDRVRDYYLSPQTLAEAAAQINFPEDRRSALVAALRKYNGDSPELEMLARPGTVAIVTGQQVGLFTGPAYTIYKALTAVKLARHLTQQGFPAVPVFWLATEDHDLAEVNHAWLFDGSFNPAKVSIAPESAANQPVGTIRLGNLILDDLHSALEGHPFGGEVAALIGRAYPAGSTMGEAFASLLKEILKDYPMLFIDPMAAPIRDLGAPMIRKALEAGPELTRALLARNKELEKAGYHAQVHFEESTSLFFLLEDGKRLALRRGVGTDNQGEYQQQGRRFSTVELQSRAHEISPNALLRPVIQDFMLPTVAYIGGPAELAYLAQSQVIYKRLLDRQPLALPRAGFTLVDHHSAKLMDRYGLCLPDFFGGEAALREKVAAKLVSPTLTALMAETRAAASQSLDRLKAELLSFDPTLAKALNRSRRKIEYQLEKTERKVARQTMLRNQRSTEDAEALTNFIYPHKHLQERLYSIVPLLAKFGPGLVDSVYENVHIDCPDHKFVTL